MGMHLNIDWTTQKGVFLNHEFELKFNKKEEKYTVGHGNLEIYVYKNNYELALHNSDKNADKICPGPKARKGTWLLLLGIQIIKQYFGGGLVEIIDVSRIKFHDNIQSLRVLLMFQNKNSWYENFGFVNENDTHIKNIVYQIRNFDITNCDFPMSKSFTFLGDYMFYIIKNYPEKYDTVIKMLDNSSVHYLLSELYEVPMYLLVE